MYPSEPSQRRVDLWGDHDWEHYRRRLFDLSEYMRSIQSAFARWYNRSYQRRGRFWADRFKSVCLGDMQAVLDCMLYVDLNPVRAGLVVRPEDWQGASITLRELGRDGWLAPLCAFLDQPTRAKALVEYRQRLYYRGSVPTKEGPRKARRCQGRHFWHFDETQRCFRGTYGESDKQLSEECRAFTERPAGPKNAKSVGPGTYSGTYSAIPARVTTPCSCKSP